MRRLATALAILAITAAPAVAGDLKQIGKRYRIKVTSAGVPTLGGVLDGYKVRTRYQVLRGDKSIGIAYLNDYIYVEEPGEYTVRVNGQSVTEFFEIPRELTRDRIKASWQRARAVELRPRRRKQRLAVPAIWVLHPPHVTGKHNDDYSIVELKGGKEVAHGVAVVYPPEEIKDIDDGVLFKNTLVHVLPGKYELRINGASLPLEIAEGQTRLVRLSALSVAAGSTDIQQLIGKRRLAVKRPTGTAWFVAPPGAYRMGDARLKLGMGEAKRFAALRTLPGLKRPRLGIRAKSDNGVLVLGFVPNSPAAAAGIKLGDRIVALNGTGTMTTRALGKALMAVELGTSVKLSVVREGRKEPMLIELATGLKAQPKPAAKPKAAPKKARKRAKPAPKKKAKAAPKKKAKAKKKSSTKKKAKAKAKAKTKIKAKVKKGSKKKVY